MGVRPAWARNRRQQDNQPLPHNFKRGGLRLRLRCAIWQLRLPISPLVLVPAQFSPIEARGGL